MNAKQQRFVQEYLIDLNATQAAIRAGYSAHTAEQQGCRLLRNAKIKTAVEKGQEARAERTGITQDWVLQTIYDTAERCKKADVNAASNVLRAAELAGKHLRMFTDNAHIEGNLEIKWQK